MRHDRPTYPQTILTTSIILGSSRVSTSKWNSWSPSRLERDLIEKLAREGPKNGWDLWHSTKNIEGVETAPAFMSKGSWENVSNSLGPKGKDLIEQVESKELKDDRGKKYFWLTEDGVRLAVALGASPDDMRNLVVRYGLNFPRINFWMWIDFIHELRDPSIREKWFRKLMDGPGDSGADLDAAALNEAFYEWRSDKAAMNAMKRVRANPRYADTIKAGKAKMRARASELKKSVNDWVDNCLLSDDPQAYYQKYKGIKVSLRFGHFLSLRPNFLFLFPSLTLRV